MWLCEGLEDSKLLQDFGKQPFFEIGMVIAVEAIREANDVNKMLQSARGLLPFFRFTGHELVKSYPVRIQDATYIAPH